MSRRVRQVGPAGVRVGAFTLLEVMVAVATGLLLVLAISSLFASAGGTIETGRRISTFNRKASVIEQQIRRDLSKITREGYLIIRHAVADDGPPPLGSFVPRRVAASSDDSAPRLRRVDELMFFVKEPSVSARSPLAPGFVAKGASARVYYGHGAIADALAPDALLIPEYDMGLSGGSGGPGDGGTSLQNAIGLLGEPDGPNEFAEDWILVRHQTVLTQPQSPDQVLPTAFLDPFDSSPQDDPRLLDGERQIALQPALGSIFRHVGYAQRTAPENGADGLMREQSEYDRGAWLVQQSNLFDIATTDLREIRQRVMTMHDGPFVTDYTPPQNPETDPLNIVPVSPWVLEDDQDLLDFPVKGYTPYLSPTRIESSPTGDRAQLLFNGIHAWMRGGMPTDSQGEDEEAELRGIRLHAEPSPPALLDVLDPARFDPETLEAADRLNDQLMLSASNLGVRVGEFMVEWSFGQTYLNTTDPNDPRNGEIIWYGGHTPVDLDGDELADDVIFHEYQSRIFTRPDAPVLAYDRATGVQIERTDGSGSVHIVRDFLIHGPRDPSDNQRNNPMYSYFGWDDPTYRPLNEGDVETVPWPWPTMLRITISLIDEQDPTIEQSYQFVVDLRTEN